jgi:hypothetical protein
MASIYRLSVLITLVVFAVWGCGNGKIEQLTSELSDTRKEVRALQAENARVNARCSQLQTELMETQANHAHLKTREAQLAQWSRQLAEQFGPSVWYFGQDERPLPYRLIENATPQLLIEALNDLLKTAGLPEVTLLRIEENTAFVHISDDEHLTQKMGSAGATGYIQAVTYTLCSLPDIAHVDFDFREGDHAVPGRYSR